MTHRTWSLTKAGAQVDAASLSEQQLSMRLLQNYCRVMHGRMRSSEHLMLRWNQQHLDLVVVIQCSH